MKSTKVLPDLMDPDLSQFGVAVRSPRTAAN
jgi:hypothetical protein